MWCARVGGTGVNGFVGSKLQPHILAATHQQDTQTQTQTRQAQSHTGILGGGAVFDAAGRRREISSLLAARRHPHDRTY